jgi:hypothetical protein
MYFPWNWEFDSALSKLQDFGEGTPLVIISKWDPCFAGGDVVSGMPFLGDNVSFCDICAWSHTVQCSVVN